MFAIARKTSFFFLTHLGTFSLPAFLLLKGKGSVISMMAIFVPAWLSSSVLWSEKMESYAFLRMLPVTDREIVRVKFGLALAAAFVYWLILSLLVRAAWGSTWEYPAYVALTNLTCAISLPLVACWYIFYWRFGISALTAGVLAFVVLDVIATFVVNVDHGNWVGAPGIPIIRWLAEVPWYPQLYLFLAAFAAYYGLMEVAIRVKARSEACL
ncbi:MAG: ABC-2 transporter permease [Acidobacteriia bacterium]|nr:ABC-2 transporter permease [Terriglobia bacterium]